MQKKCLTMAFPSPPPATGPALYTYHCLCSTLLLTTPYTLSSLPVRASASGDKTRILPLPPLSIENPSLSHEFRDTGREGYATEASLPSLLSNTRPARKAIVVQREDGWEKRRVWRCGRCALGWGYEIEIAEGEEAKEKSQRVVYLLDGGLVETAAMIGARC